MVLLSPSPWGGAAVFLLPSGFSTPISFGWWLLSRLLLLADAAYFSSSTFQVLSMIEKSKYLQVFNGKAPPTQKEEEGKQHHQENVERGDSSLLPPYLWLGWCGLPSSSSSPPPPRAWWCFFCEYLKVPRVRLSGDQVAGQRNTNYLRKGHAPLPKSTVTCKEEKNLKKNRHDVQRFKQKRHFNGTSTARPRRTTRATPKTQTTPRGKRKYKLPRDERRVFNDRSVNFPHQNCVCKLLKF